MSWLNLNQSLNSLKGQITNFASEVLSEVPAQDTVDDGAVNHSPDKDLQEKCHHQELEIASLKKLVDELQTSLQSERLSKKNGVKEEESSWYWDPPSDTSGKPIEPDVENTYKNQIRDLQNELSTLKERNTIDIRPDDELNRLREENKNLSANLEDLDNQHQQAMERLLSLKKELQKNFEVLKQEHDELKNANEEYSAEMKNLLFKIGERDKEIENIKSVKSDYDTLSHKYQNLERIHGLLRENAEKFQEENQELHEEIFKLQEQITKLEHDVEEVTKHAERSDMVPRDTYEELVKEINALKDRRNSNLIHMDEINIDDNAKGVIETLKRDISDLKHKLAQKESSTHENIDNKVKPEKVMQLYNKYVNFELPIDYVGEIPTAGDNIVLYKLESVFKTVNSFKKEIDVLQQKISEKNLNASHLQTQIDDITTENDFLTTDIQHLERELSEMKKNNDFLISEIAALKNTSKLEPIIETHEDNLAKLETELADCNRINKNFESEIKRIEKQLGEVQQEKKSLHESLFDLKQKYTTMLSELDMCKHKTNAVEELENSAKAKESLDVDELKKRLSSANSKNEQLLIDIHILENDKVLLTKEVDDLKTTLEEKSSAHKELTCLKLTLDQKLHDFATKLDEVIKHKNEIENEKFYLEDKVSHLENQVCSASTKEDILSLTTEKNMLIEKVEHMSITNVSLSETIAKLESEITRLIQRDRELSDKYSLLTEQLRLEKENKSVAQRTEKDENNALQKTIEQLKEKLVQHETVTKEVSTLKDENLKLIERKLQLEAELSTTDGKIVHLEEEFEKLIADLNEKDTIIDALNATIEQNKLTINTLNQNTTDLEHSLEVKNVEIQRLKKLSEESLVYNDEITKIQAEKEEISLKIISMGDEIATKNIEISSLSSKIAELEKMCNDYKQTIDNKEKEIKELGQSLVEVTDKIKTFDNVTHHNDEYAKLVQEKDIVETELNELKAILAAKDNAYQELKGMYEQTETTSLEYQRLVNTANTEKAELINLINLKHNESIQYHNEIQRLNHVILEQTNEFKKVIEDKDNLIQSSDNTCANCERLNMNVKEKDEIIIRLNQAANDYERIRAELVNATDTVSQLKDRCEQLDRSLSMQVDRVKKLTAENAQLSEQYENSSRELERLRRHLMETEENYTQELMASEQKLTECTARLHQVEERAKQTSTVYTSNSIRANQEVETLRNQIKLLEKQREEVQSRLSDAEDSRNRSEAALTNLQVVLEQFQLDKERDIHNATEKIRNKMEELKRENHSLHAEISRLNNKLEEALAGLQAATRLGDQVETKTAQINDLKEQVRTLQTSVSAAEERYYNAISNQQDKVDKNLVKNLVINYTMTAANSSNKTQVLRVLSTVLDFNQQECEKLGLVRSTTTPDSLAAEFVKFLQNESRPRANLPNMMTLAQGSSRSTTPSSRKNSTIGPPPNLPRPSHSRNPSTGSNNLLFQNIDTLDTASQRSIESDREPKVVSPSLDTGVNQTRNTEGAILKSVLKDM